MSRTTKTSPDLIRNMLNIAGRYPLLSDTEQQQIGREMVSAREQIKLLDKNQYHELKRLRERYLSAREELIITNLRLVVAIAKKYRVNGLALGLEDLIQDGAIGLIKCVDKYDPEKGFKFSTYAYTYVKGYISRAITDSGRTIRLPSHIQGQLFKLRFCIQELSIKLGRQPSKKEIAEYLKLPVNKLEGLLSYGKKPHSLNRLVGQDLDTELIDLVAVDNSDEDTNSRVSNLDRHEILQDLLAELSPVERRVVKQKFGVDDEQQKECSFMEIGKRNNFSRTTANNIYDEALGKLKKRATKID